MKSSINQIKEIFFTEDSFFDPTFATRTKFLNAVTEIQKDTYVEDGDHIGNLLEFYEIWSKSASSSLFKDGELLTLIAEYKVLPTLEYLEKKYTNISNYKNLNVLREYFETIKAFYNELNSKDSNDFNTLLQLKLNINNVIANAILYDDKDAKFVGESLSGLNNLLLTVIITCNGKTIPSTRDLIETTIEIIQRFYDENDEKIA